MIIKCKMCGGDIEVKEGTTIGKCKYCGSTMTLPRIETEKKARLFNRANQYRLNNEFDKAYDAYKAIVDEDETEAEGYWGMILSEYGVEYIEDPKTQKRIPTCHRTKIQSIQSSTNYDLACKYADVESRLVYQDEAEELDRIQKQILSISGKEDPYDVFICYKESDAISGERTKDSIIGQEIYNELQREGLKVFFSRITLEDKLGQDYEPYIFSALNTAKVMLVITTSNENVSSVWVKNEWSRFLKFMADDHRKVIIPVYCDMEVYELPDELSKFQSLNYNKIGAIQDICHSVKKYVSLEDRQQKDSVLEDIIQDRVIQEQKKNERIVRRKKTVASLKKASIVAIIIAALGAAVYGGVYLYKNYFIPNQQYKQAMDYIDKEDYDSASALLEQLGDYRDSADAINLIKLRKAQNQFNNGDYENAYKALSEVGEGKYSEEAEEYKYKCLYEIQMGMDKKYSNLGDYQEGMTEDMVYNMGVHMLEVKAYEAATEFLSTCINYKDSVELWKQASYLIAKGMTDSAKQIYQLLIIADGTKLKEDIPDYKGDDLSYEPARNEFNSLAESYYEEALTEIDATNWDSAKKPLQVLLGVHYKDVAELIDKCNEHIANEKAIYNGVWRNNGGWTHMKIEDGNIMFSNDPWERENKEWSKDTKSVIYNGDTGVLSFTYWDGDVYDVVVNGNSLKLVCTSRKDQWDTDWFGDNNTFSKS